MPGMNVISSYPITYLIRAAWGFFLGWIVLLLVAWLVAFRSDLP
jgi:hypothetical protein